MLDFDNRLFSNIIASKTAPLSQVPSEVSPVDWVSKSIVQISHQKVKKGSISQNNLIGLNWRKISFSERYGVLCE